MNKDINKNMNITVGKFYALININKNIKIYVGICTEICKPQYNDNRDKYGNIIDIVDRISRDLKFDNKIQNFTIDIKNYEDFTIVETEENVADTEIDILSNLHKYYKKTRCFYNNPRQNNEIYDKHPSWILQYI